MELDLTLGDPSKPPGLFSKIGDVRSTVSPDRNSSGAGIGFCMALGICFDGGASTGQSPSRTPIGDGDGKSEEIREGQRARELDEQMVSPDSSSRPPVHLDLVLRRTPSNSQGFPWSSDNGSSDGVSSGTAARGFDVNRPPTSAVPDEVSSPNSVASSFRVDFSLFGGDGTGRRDSGNDVVVENERASSRASEEEDNGVNPRKKLRLSKDQSAFLEESFKEHHTLNPKQKLALAKQLNLSTRQVEVWFQNRRARTKLKQTEVECEYLKRCCETLKEENRRLQKEVQELRALKSTNQLFAQLPATTLTMCPSCERVGPTAAAANYGGAGRKEADAGPEAIQFPITRKGDTVSGLQ